VCSPQGTGLLLHLIVVTMLSMVLTVINRTRGWNPRSDDLCTRFPVAFVVRLFALFQVSVCRAISDLNRLTSFDKIWHERFCHYSLQSVMIGVTSAKLCFGLISDDSWLIGLPKICSTMTASVV
jgi:hypothetical protein